MLRRTRPDMERPYRAFGYPVLPALYIVAAGLIEILLLLYKPSYTWPGLIIVLLGVPVYFCVAEERGQRMSLFRDQAVKSHHGRVREASTRSSARSGRAT